MKKKISMILAVVFIATLFVAVSPKHEVYAKSTFEMDFNELCDYWSARSDFLQVYYAEVDRAPYIFDVKANIRKYFVASLVDYVLSPNELAASRPITYNYMVNVMAQSNPGIYYAIKDGNYAYTLPEILLHEMNQIAPYLSYEDKAHNVPILISYLNMQGVYTVSQYEQWKVNNGGKTAFEVYINHVRDASDSWTNQIYSQMQAAGQAQAQLQSDIAAAAEVQAAWQEDMMDKAGDQWNAMQSPDWWNS